MYQFVTGSISTKYGQKMKSAAKAMENNMTMGSDNENEIQE